MPTTYISEHDVRSFLREPTSAFLPLKRALLTVAAASLGAAAVYLLLNAQALLYMNNVGPLAAASTPQATAQVFAAVPTAPPTAEPLTPDIPENTLSVAALGISAPIAWDIPFDEKLQAQLLPNTTIQLAGTAHPGQHGVIAISGHSSNYPWIKGSFNNVFAPLVHAEPGQMIEINFQNKLYRYQVSKVYEIKPTEVQYLQDNTRNTLRLFTCTPIGTSLRRLVVEADQIYPDPAANTTFTSTVTGDLLPNDR